MPEYYVPEVIDDLTSKTILTTELIEGTSLDRIENPDQETVNKVLLKTIFMKITTHMKLNLQDMFRSFDDHLQLKVELI